MTRRAANGTHRRWGLGLVTCALIATACDRAGAPDYRVVIDLGPTIAALTSDDLDVASTAEDEIVAVGPPAVPALRTALGREDEPVRLAIVEALALMRGEAVATLLVDTLRGDPSGAVRAETAFALRAFASRPLDPEFRAALEDPDPAVRRQVSTACGAVCREPASAEALLAHALADDVSVWWAARTALGRLRTRRDGPLARAVDAAVMAAAPAALAGADEARAARAALLLADAGDARGAGRLRALVADGDPVMRQQAVIALGALGDAGAVPVLERAAADPQLKVLAAAALQRIRSDGVAPTAPPGAGP